MKFIKILELQTGEAWLWVALPSRAETAPQRLSDVLNHKVLENSLSKPPLQSAILCGHLPVYQIKMELNRKKEFENHVETHTRKWITREKIETMALLQQKNKCIFLGNITAWFTRSLQFYWKTWWQIVLFYMYLFFWHQNHHWSPCICRWKGNTNPGARMRNKIRPWTGWICLAKSNIARLPPGTHDTDWEAK